MSNNQLIIRAASLNLDLAGEREYIRQAYDAIRPVLMERFADSIPRAAGVADTTMPTRDTLKLHGGEAARVAAAVADTTISDEEGPHHINIVMCNEVYNKVYLVDREELETSVFSRVIDMERVQKIYVNRSQQDRFRAFFKFGKVLWRELTSVGKAAVKSG